MLGSEWTGRPGFREQSLEHAWLLAHALPHWPAGRVAHVRLFT